jgi:hypothetical protein
MARTIVRLAVVGLVVHALYRFVPVYVHYQQFKDAVHETALFARGRSSEQIVDRVMELAERYRVPLERDAVTVTREGEKLFIEATYVESIEWLPTYKRPWYFTITDDAGIVVRPVEPNDIGR